MTRPSVSRRTMHLNSSTTNHPRMVLSLVAIPMIFFATLGTHALAATIQSLSLLAGESGQRLSIGLDQPAEYQVFELQGPSKLVLNFPGTSLKEGITELEGAGGVKSILPTQDKDGSRLEIHLSDKVKYEIEDKGKSLLVSFSGGADNQKTAKGAELKDIQVREKGAVTELILRGADMDANHNSLMTNEGQTMVLDFWNGTSRLLKEHFSYSTQRVSDVTVGSAEGRLRLVVKLLPGAGNHQIMADKNQMVIRFGKVAEAASQGEILVEAVDFQPDNRVANLVIRTDTTNPVINLHEKDGNVVIDLKNARLAEGQERSLDVRAFSSPVRQVDSYGVNKDVRIIARLRQKSAVTSYQSGNVLTVTLEPEDLVAAKPGEEKAGDKPAYTGQKVTFNFKDIDIRNALKLIAEMSDINIIMTDDVTGLLTMRLVDVPWDQALELILASKGLGKEQSGNVMRIAPLKVLKADADARKEASESVEAVAPLETEFIQLGYASVNDVSVILKGESAASDAEAQTTTQGTTVSQADTSGVGGEGGLKLLSDRGSILLDERSNTMIVTDTRERLDNIKRLIAVIDKPMKQILIEARIVEASDTFSRDLGVKWGGQYSDQGTTGRFSHTVAGKSVGTNVVDLGAAVAAGSGGAIGYTLGTLSGALNLNLELSAAETAGKIKVVSSPRVFTSNLQEALIEEDKQIPFAQTTFAGGVTTTSTVLISAKLTLQVTPQVTADNRIIMKLIVNKDTPIANPIQGGDPTIDKKKVETKLLVKNGETVVLGGIYSQTLSENVAGVPVLQDIPLLGNLFKRKQKTDDRNELLIFITPIIIADEST